MVYCIDVDVEEDESGADTQDVDVAADVEEERTMGATLRETASSD